MKRFLLIVCLAVMGMSAYAQKGQNTVGVSVLYGTWIENPGIGAKYSHSFTDSWRAEANFNYFFKKLDITTMWDVNLNAHYVFNVGERWGIYPLAGVSFARINNDLGIISTNLNRFGVNVGAGVDFALSSHFALNLEAKYQLLKDFSQFVPSFGVKYSF